MSLSIPIFPGFKPGQSFNQPPTPVRAPKWNYKETLEYRNFRQEAVNGRVTVVKYWPNPKHLWQWTYGYLYDDPSGNLANLGQNSFFEPVQMPDSDFHIAKGFYAAMQGQGNEFAYCPEDYLVGPTYGSIANVALTNDVLTFSGLSGTITAGIAPYVGKMLYLTNFSSGSFTFLNGQYVLILGVTSSTITCFLQHSNVSGVGGETGTISMSDHLGNVDSNFNVEIVHKIGSYPTLNAQTYSNAFTLVNESVQLLDQPTLNIYDSTGASLAGIYTLAQPQTVSGYAGYVAQFPSAPAHQPLFASYNLYYLARFSEDTQEFENFMTMLWMASTVKFEQVKL